jgi:hypothetical protein
VKNYELVLSERAAMTFAGLGRAEQRRIAVTIDALKANPFRPGDLFETDAYGRRHEVLLVGDWLFIFWIDHAAREVRLMRLESTARD